MALVRDVEWEACLLEPRSNTEIEKRFKRVTGQPAAQVVYFTTSDWVGDALIELYSTFYNRVHIDHDLADMASMMVSQDNSCRYCFAATRAVLRITGMSQKRISELESNLATADIDEQLRGALEFSRRLSHSNPAPVPADIESLIASGYSREEVIELAATVATMVFFTRMATLPALPPQFFENLPDRWFARLLRPLLAIRFRSFFRGKDSPKFLTEEEKQGPFSKVVCALDGLPAASAFLLDGL